MSREAEMSTQRAGGERSDTYYYNDVGALVVKQVN